MNKPEGVSKLMGLSLEGYARVFWALRRLARAEENPERRAEFQRDADNYRILFKMRLAKNKKSRK